MSPLTIMYTKQLTFLNMELPKAYNLKYFFLEFILKFNLAVNEMLQILFTIP